jgi:hypothetical protein
MAMKPGKIGISFRRIASVISIFSLLLTVQVATTAFAADGDAPPKSGSAAGGAGNPDKTAAAAGRAGEEAGRSVSRGVSAGTIAFSLAMVAGTIAIGVATFGGGDTTTPAHH